MAKRLSSFSHFLFDIVVKTVILFPGNKFVKLAFLSSGSFILV